MNKKEQLLSKIKQEQQELKDNNYLGVIDERETRINALVKAMETEELDDNEISILLRQKSLLTTLANLEPKWKSSVWNYGYYADCSISNFLDIMKSEPHCKKKHIDEEM